MTLQIAAIHRMRQFTSYLAQIQYSQLLAERLHITARALAQYAADPLLSIEKYALGGIKTVRGYRQNQVVRDNAYLALSRSALSA